MEMKGMEMKGMEMKGNKDDPVKSTNGNER